MTKMVMDLLVWKNFLVTTGGTQVSSLGMCGKGWGRQRKMEEELGLIPCSAKFSKIQGKQRNLKLI